jgi:hypothetical protein
MHIHSSHSSSPQSREEILESRQPEYDIEIKQKSSCSIEMAYRVTSDHFHQNHVVLFKGQGVIGALEKSVHSAS